MAGERKWDEMVHYMLYKVGAALKEEMEETIYDASPQFYKNHFPKYQITVSDISSDLLA